MARGQQKIQSQQKAAKKAQELKKRQNHDQKAAAQKALTHICTICKVYVVTRIFLFIHFAIIMLKKNTNLVIVNHMN